MSRFNSTFTIAALSLALAACKGEEPAAGKAEPVEATAAPSEPPPDEPIATANEPAPTPVIDRLLAYLPATARRVAYQRLSADFDADALEVVFALPPQAGDLLDERKLLDEGLDIVLDGDAEPGNWLAPASLGFTVELAKSTYFLRSTSKPIAEIGPLLADGFTRTEIDGVEVWLPKGSFPWRIALLDGDVAAFVPVDVVGSGLEPLLAAKQEAEQAPIEVELATVMKGDPGMELALFAVGPLVHFDLRAPIAQVNFFLRKQGDAYAGQVQLRPDGDLQASAEQLRTRAHPEENQQIQALIGALAVTVQDPEKLVVGQLELPPDRLKHLLDL